MPKLRFRVEINKGGEGASMSKLAAITAQTEKFLLMLVQDVGVENPNGQWVAKDFDNNSVDYNAEWVGIVTPSDEVSFNAALNYVTSPDIDLGQRPPQIRPSTIFTYTSIAQAIDVDEAVHFGIFGNNGDGSIFEPRQLTKQHALDLQAELKVDDTVTYLGSIQGIVHSAVVEGKERSFKLRALYSGELIKCDYELSQYDDLVEMLEKQEAVVHVEGWMTASHTTQKVLSVKVVKMERAADYENGDEDKFIGLLSNRSLDSDSQPKDDR